jgi:hypothetical protein
MVGLYAILGRGNARKERERDKEIINKNSNSNGWHVCSGTRDPAKVQRMGDIFVQGPILLSFPRAIHLASWGSCFVNPSLSPLPTTQQQHNNKKNNKKSNNNNSTLLLLFLLFLSSFLLGQGTTDRSTSSLFPLSHRSLRTQTLYIIIAHNIFISMVSTIIELHTHAHTHQ